MTERLLQYIWQLQYFNKTELETTNGERINIIHPGVYNTNQGPDFLEARIKIENNIWIGNIELHVNASDWHLHAHANDRNYRNIILHVIWKDDDEHPDHDIPTLLLRDRVPKLLLQQYEQWMNSNSFLPCGQYLHSIADITWISWQERLFIERLQRKSMTVLSMLEENNYDWQETCWWMMAKSYGLPVNAEAFEEIARSVCYNELLANRTSCAAIMQLLMEKSKSIMQPLHLLRMRPASFPKIRLQQLAELVSTTGSLWQTIIRSENVKQLRSVFPDNVIINAAIPMLAAFGNYYQLAQHTQRAIDFATQLSAEKNSITRGFTQYGIDNKNAAGSQALIELKTQYCDKRRCLDCAIGSAILKRKV